MIHLVIPLPLSQIDIQNLQALQQQVDAEPTYERQVITVGKQWNSKPIALFQRVRAALEVTCTGARRCTYCEDSAADEVEHIRPKNWFPDQAFQPSNYLFACGPCNGPKNNKYAVVDYIGNITEAIRAKNAPVLPPPVGQEALLNPWHDDASRFFYLDLINTFEFQPKSTLNLQDHRRAVYTRDTLRINKDFLTKARKEAFDDFAGRICRYYKAERDHEPPAVLAMMRQELLKKQYITVWREMQRQYTTYPHLQKLFSLVPGIEHW